MPSLSESLSPTEDKPSLQLPPLRMPSHSPNISIDEEVPDSYDSVNHSSALQALNSGMSSDRADLEAKFSIFRNTYVPESWIPMSNNIHDERLFGALENLPFSEWLVLHKYRKATRVAYADDVGSIDFTIEEWEQALREAKLCREEEIEKVARLKKSTPSRQHAANERDRRVRHGWLQCHLDQLCSEFHFQLGEEFLPELKVCLRQGPASNKPSATKGTGKDEQLTATLFQQRMSHWIQQVILNLMLGDGRESAVVKHDYDHMMSPPPSPHDSHAANSSPHGF